MSRCSLSSCINISEVHKICGKCKHAKYCSVACQRQDWPRHKKACKDFENESAGPPLDLGTDFINHYDQFIKKNDELLCFFAFRALYGKLRTHVAFLDFEYHPGEAVSFTAIPSSLVVYSLEEMLGQNKRNADISKSITANINSLHTSTYVVGVCIFEVVNIARTSEGYKWARMAQFSRETELTEASAHITAVDILVKCT